MMKNNGKVNSALDAISMAMVEADQYEAVLVVGITKDKKDKNVKFFGSEANYQLITSVVNGMSVEITAGRLKL